MTKKSVRNGFIAVLVVMLMVAGFGPGSKAKSSGVLSSSILFPPDRTKTATGNYGTFEDARNTKLACELGLRKLSGYFADENLLAAWWAKRGLILSLAIAFVALQTCDAFFTMWAMNHGFQEVNPYMAGIAGSWLSPVVKILPAALVSFGVVKVGKRFTVAATVGLSAVVAFYLVVIASNIGEVIK